MEEFVKKDYTEVIEALESGMLDTSDLASYIDIILHSLYMCRNQCAEDDEFKITPEEAEKLMKSFMHQATSITIKPCPYLLPCGFCDKRDGELCSQFFRT